jgi:hypothetical protein
MRLTTAITAATPITTPMSARTLRSLCAHRLEAEMATASDKFNTLQMAAELPAYLSVSRGVSMSRAERPLPRRGRVPSLPACFLRLVLGLIETKKRELVARLPR